MTKGYWRLKLTVFNVFPYKSKKKIWKSKSSRSNHIWSRRVLFIVFYTTISIDSDLTMCVCVCVKVYVYRGVSLVQCPMWCPLLGACQTKDTHHLSCHHHTGKSSHHHHTLLFVYTHRHIRKYHLHFPGFWFWNYNVRELHGVNDEEEAPLLLYVSPLRKSSIGNWWLLLYVSPFGITMIRWHMQDDD